MHRIPVAAISIGIVLGAFAPPLGAHSLTPDRVPASAPAGGRVHGFVRDAAGVAVADASVLAVGATVVMSRSDGRGRFQMTLPVGDYVLRATRAGYVSTYREAVRVQSSLSLERVITLVRQEETAVAAKSTDTHAHTDLAWQLRHLPRSVLRDGGPQTEWTYSDPSDLGRPAGSLWGRAVDSSLRLASRLADTDFTGQLNFVTTASANPAVFATSAQPRRVAYVVLGAPMGSAGDWRIRGAIGSGTESSWNVLGEYTAHRTEAHALRVGMSYSSHGPRVPGLGRYSRSILEARSVAGAFAGDRWRPLSGLEVEYAVRADRYDFLADPYLLSASGGLRATMMPATFLTIRGGRSMVAPGAEEFLPPATEGPWLPPERTFAALTARERMRAETVRHVELGLAREIGRPGRSRAVHARAFTQLTTDQFVTLFSTRADSSAGHYQVATAGEVAISGWAVGVSGALLRGVDGHLEYSRMAADWNGSARTRGLRHVAPGVVRPRHEWLDDLSASVEASLNEARTRVSFVYRHNTAFSDDALGTPGAGGRFDVQLHQALPYQPLPGSRLELLFAVRTLFRDPQAGTSPYDELLTVSPPLRLMGGILVKF